jgi:uncharacterized protein with HEPN domain
VNVSEKRRAFRSQLDLNIKSLEKSIDALSYSYNKCSDIGEKKEYSLEEQEKFEALTSRFARTSDILTQKVLKTLFILIQENVKTIIDAANLLEKLEIIERADDLLNIRELRNQIAHEYQDTELNSLFMDVLKYVPELEKIVDGLKKYLKEVFPGNENVPLDFSPQSRRGKK